MMKNRWQIIPRWEPDSKPTREIPVISRVFAMLYCCQKQVIAVKACARTAICLQFRSADMTGLLLPDRTGHIFAGQSQNLARSIGTEHRAVRTVFQTGVFPHPCEIDVRVV